MNFNLTMNKNIARFDIKRFSISFIIFFVVLSSVFFFSLRIFGSLYELKLMQVMGEFILLLFLVVYLIRVISKSKVKKRDNFSKYIIFLIFIFFISNLMAYFLHNQNLLRSFIGSRFLLFYLFYFILKVLSPTEDQLIKIFIFISLIFIFIYLYQLIIYPNVVVYDQINIRYGIPRFHSQGFSIMIFVLFFIFFKLICQKINIFFIMLTFFILLIIILYQTRMLYLSLGLTPFFGVVIFRKVPVVKNRFLLIIILLVFCVVLIFIMPSIITLIQDTISEISSGKGNLIIRFQAAEFYVLKYLNNIPAILFGNGFPNQVEQFGKEVLYYKEYFGFYSSDIGYIGFLFHYGLLGISTIIFIIFKCIKISNQKGYLYLKYYLIYLLISSITFPNFESTSSIIILCSVIYLVEEKDNENFSHYSNT